MNPSPATGRDAQDAGQAEEPSITGDSLAAETVRLRSVAQRELDREREERLRLTGTKPRRNRLRFASRVRR